MPRRPASWLAVGAVSVLVLAAAFARADDRPKAGARADDASADAPSKPDGSGVVLAMTPAVACRSIGGFEDYETLPGAALTSDEKLLIYYRPQNYRIERSGDSFHIHLAQDFQIRRRGEKAVLQRKDKIVDYDVKITTPPGPVYLRNTVGLKGLKPGDYDIDLILHDKLAGDATVTQALPFRVVAAALPKPEVDVETPPPAPRPSPKAKPRRGRR